MQMFKCPFGRRSDQMRKGEPEPAQTREAPAGDRRAQELRRREPLDLTEPDLRRLIQSLEEEMHEAAADLRFEYAARLRDEVNDLKRELSDLAEAAH